MSLRLIILLLIALSLPAEARVVYLDSISEVSDTVVIAADVDADRLVVEARGNSRGRWGIQLGDVSVSIAGESNFKGFEQENTVRLTVATSDSVLFTKDCPGIFSSHPKDENTLAVGRSRDGLLTVEGGSRELKEIAVLTLPTDFRMTASIFAEKPLALSLVALETEIDPAATLQTDWTLESLTAYLVGSRDETEAIWDFLDADTDDRRARRGGRYSVATVSNPDGGYDLIYLGGAEVGSDRWRPGMIKGRLKPTIFKDHYDVVWYDAVLEPILTDVSCFVDQKAILSVSFPRYRSTLRFSRRPRK